MRGFRGALVALPFALWLGGIWGACGVLIGQGVGGVVFGLIAVWLGLRTIDQVQAKAQAAPK